MSYKCVETSSVNQGTSPGRTDLDNLDFEDSPKKKSLGSFPSPGVAENIRRKRMELCKYMIISKYVITNYNSYLVVWIFFFPNRK